MFSLPCSLNFKTPSLGIEPKKKISTLLGIEPRTTPSSGVKVYSVIPTLARTLLFTIKMCIVGVGRYRGSSFEFGKFGRVSLVNPEASLIPTKVDDYVTWADKI